MAECKSIYLDQLFFHSYFPIELLAQINPNLVDQEATSSDLYPTILQA